MGSENKKSGVDLLEKGSFTRQLGLVANEDLSSDNICEFREMFEARLEKIEIQPLFFEEIYTLQFTYRTPANGETIRDAREWYGIDRKGPGSEIRVPRNIRYRHGVTGLHDKSFILWDRRPVAEYVRDGNRLPKGAISVLGKLKDFGLPFNCLITILTPSEYENQMTDPIMVLEFNDKVCIPICRWNPSL